MATSPKHVEVIGISGSLRPGSNTARAVEAALAGARDAGADVRMVPLSELDLPWCDGRADESSYGGDTARLRATVAAADALVIGSPEYHGSLTGVLKNALDLLGPEQMTGKLVGLVATARGDAGAMNTLNHLQHICRWMRAWVLPEQVSIPRAQEAFGPDGTIVKPGLQDELERLGAELVRYTGLLAG